MDVKIKNFNTVRTSKDKLPASLDESIYDFLIQEKNRYEVGRDSVQDLWLEAWSLYLGTPVAVDEQRKRTLYTVGEVNSEWRHKISTGKAYEVVETIHGYLMSATFPNSEWFSMSPNAPGYAQLARVVRKYLANKMDEANFRAHYAMFLRQLLITGTSVMALPWRYETRPYKKNVVVKKVIYDPLMETEEEVREVVQVEEPRLIKNHPEFETLDVFDCWVDPSVCDPNEGGFFRRIVKTRAEVINLAQQGYYDVSPLDVIEVPAYRGTESDEQDSVRLFQGIETDDPYSMGDKVELLEFWGDVHLDGITFYDVCATILDKQLIKFQPNEFWAGKPFVIGSATPTPQSPYSIGAIQPSMGLLHELNIITNQRLDNMEINIDTVLLVRQDGVLNPEDVYVAPGKTIYVTDPSSVQALQLPQNQNISYTEASVLEQTIDKNAGTGAMISANTSRSGERVTAAEIQATRDAGGNRLSNLQAHIESTSLKPILSRVFRNSQQFVTDDELVRVSGRQAGEFNYFRVGADELCYDFTIKPVGSEHVIDRTKYIQDRISFLQAVAQVPQMAERLNYEAILYDMVQHFGFDDPDSYVVQPYDPNATAMSQLAQAAPVAAGSLVSQADATSLQQKVSEVSQPLSDAVEANFKADGGRELFKNMVGIETNPTEAALEQEQL
jgi:hypothetical protein